MGLDCSTCSECLPERTCHFQPPQHVPRTSAGAQTCVWGLGGLPVCHGADSTRKDPRPEEKKMPKGEKTHLSIYMYEYILFVHADERGGTCAHVENCQHANQKQLT